MRPDERAPRGAAMVLQRAWRRRAAARGALHAVAAALVAEARERASFELACDELAAGEQEFGRRCAAFDALARRWSDAPLEARRQEWERLWYPSD